jgi:putative transposase
MDLGRSSFYYRHRKDAQEALRQRLRELALDRPRYGYRRLHVLLEREGWRVNHKRVHRIYCEEGLMVRTKRRRKVASQTRLVLPESTRPNERWAIDFVADQLFDGRRFRILTAVDTCTRELLLVHAAFSLPAGKVTKALDQVIAVRGVPEAVTLDNGTEFTSRVFDSWAFQHRISLDFIRPGRPVENGTIESFNGRLRDECLSQHWFHSLDEARKILDDFKRDYNEIRPHSSLENRTPNEVAERLLAWASG